MTRDEFVREIERFLNESGMTPSRLGKDAIGDTAFVKRLRADPRKTVTLRTIEKVIGHINKERRKMTTAA